MASSKTALVMKLSSPMAVGGDGVQGSDGFGGAQGVGWWASGKGGSGIEVVGEQKEGDLGRLDFSSRGRIFPSDTRDVMAKLLTY